MSRNLLFLAATVVLCVVASWSLSDAVAQTSDTGAAATDDSATAATSDATDQPSQTQSSAVGESAAANDAASDDLFGESTPTPATEQADTATAQPGTSNQPGVTSSATTPGTRAVTSGQQQTSQQQQTNLDATSAEARLRQQQRDLLAGLQFGQATDRGLTVANIAAGSAFLDSGLLPGDVVIALNNQPIRTEAEFTRLIALNPGQRVPMTVLRGGRQETIFFTYPDHRMATRPDMDAGMMDRSAQYEANRPIAPTGGPAFLGVAFDMQFYDAAAIRDVLPDSAAQQAGLREGDVIVALNGQRISSPEQALRLIRSMQAGDALEIEYTRRMPNRAQATLGARPTSGPGAVSYAPREEVDVYRGGPPDDEFQSEPVPFEQAPDMPPPTLPSDDFAPPDELP